MRSVRRALSPFLSLLIPLAEPAAQEPPMNVAPASREALDQIPSFALTNALECDLVAAEPMLSNVVAFSVDDRGRILAAETFRIQTGVFDTRSYMQWKDEDLACRTVGDRIAKYRRHIGEKLPDYEAYSERVQMLVDEDRDGIMDRSTVFAEGFHDIADGIAAGVLRVGNDVFLTNIPKLWLLNDDDGDGKADRRRVVADGFGVHTSLIGHDMHGLIVGPDRRLYFSIGDRGFSVRKDGVLLDYSDEGAVLRCELDGSSLEVYHRGLRNPQELAFDDFGDLFTGDNNSDGGDRARFVAVVDGGDSGWRIGFQWLEDRGAWNHERLWLPRFAGQAAWIVPPVLNVADGPSGLAYDAGIGLPDRFRRHFLLCDFRGTAAISGIRALEFAPSGAGYEVVDSFRPVWRVLCTDVDIAPDGSLLFSDWVDGWTKTGKGRIYRARTREMANDLRLRNNARLLAQDFGMKTEGQLVDLLGHADRRVRQKAEFALVDRGARDALARAARSSESRLARLAAIWGLGVLARAHAKVAELLRPFLDDGDAEIRAQTAVVLGDARDEAAVPKLIERLSDPNSRVRFRAAVALGRIGGGAGVGPALIRMARENADRDAFLRHAAALSLSRIGDEASLRAAASDADAPVRMVALLAMRRLSSPEIPGFLDDPEESLRIEAARAIHDVPIESALPALAAEAKPGAPDLLVWRALNAHRRIGSPENGRALIAFALDPGASAAMRLEALAILREWKEPHGQDRVTGLWRPCRHEDAEAVAAALDRAMPALLADDAVAPAAAAIAGERGATSAIGPLSELVADDERGLEARKAALEALSLLGGAAADSVAKTIDAGDPAPLRALAVKIYAEKNPALALPVLETLLENGEIGERQAAMQALGDMKGDEALGTLREWLSRLERGEVPGAIQLELIEAAEKRPELRPRVDQWIRGMAAEDPLAPWRPCMEGGDPEGGRRVFSAFEATRCTRCHSIRGEGGDAGPKLDDVGERRDRAYLLQALVDPSAVICEGYSSTVLRLHNGDVLAGIVTREQNGVVEIVDSEGKTVEVPLDGIESRSGSPTSAMPKMAETLGRRRLRDVIAFLASLRGPPAPGGPDRGR
ncbi:MAG: c-type cytochrome [Planctomycetota bacterium]